jgi:hypothetical protein
MHERLNQYRIHCLHSHVLPGNIKRKRNKDMKRKLILSASIMVLAAISGEAFAYSNVAPTAGHEVTSVQQVSHGFGAFDQTMRPQMAEPRTYRHRSGPDRTIQPDAAGWPAVNGEAGYH